MKTKELISLLNKCDPEGEAFVDCQGEYGRHNQVIDTVLESKSNGCAFIISYEEDKEV